LTPLSAPVAAEPAFSMDSDLTLSGLEIRWAATAAPEVSESANAAAPEASGSVIRAFALKSTGGTLRLDHCELTVGWRDTGIYLERASCFIANTRLNAQNGLCMAWWPRAGHHLDIQNCVLTGQCCLALKCDADPGDLPATLNLSQSTWDGKKGLHLNVSAASRLPLAIRSDHNLFAVNYLMVLSSPVAARRGVKSLGPNYMRSRLQKMIAWQEQENHYGAATQFLARQPLGQAIMLIDEAPTNVAAWEDFWNRPASGSVQGAEAKELRGKVGAREDEVGASAFQGAST